HAGDRPTIGPSSLAVIGRPAAMLSRQICSASARRSVVDMRSSTSGGGRVGVIVTGCVLPGDQGPGPCRRPGSRPACGRSLLAGLSCQENLGTSRPVALPTTRNFVSDENAPALGCGGIVASGVS